jgi:hypothetical protein
VRDGGFPKAVVRRVTGAMPIRPLLIRLNNEIRFGLFGETPSYQVIRASMAKCSSVPTSMNIVLPRKIRRLPLQLFYRSEAIGHPTLLSRS